jgi:hypothetical protein
MAQISHRHGSAAPWCSINRQPGGLFRLIAKENFDKINCMTQEVQESSPSTEASGIEILRFRAHVQMGPG